MECPQLADGRTVPKMKRSCENID